ncbi:MAG: LptF/LptG family permease [Rikenellaceae bacterium]
MKTIHRMVLKAFLGPMILTFLIVMFVLLMNFMWQYIDELVGKGLNFDIIVELISYAMVNMIPMGLPLAMLLAAIMTLGNMGESYELLAMKSAGMSLPHIIRPLIIVVFFISIAGFFITNNLVPYANKQMYSILYDIRQQKQVIEFQDGLFFNGLDNMSIRVGRQDPNTKLLRNVLIYDNRAANGDMTTTVADSGYIKLSDDKKFLLVTLYNGETYEQTRSSDWYAKSALRHNVFQRQDGVIEMEGFSMEDRTDANAFSNSSTKNISELEHAIDSLDLMVSQTTVRSYEPLIKQQIFVKEGSILSPSDSTWVDKSAMAMLSVADSLSTLDTRGLNSIWKNALNQAKSSRNMFSFDEAGAKAGLNQLYRSQVEWHRKISLPVSIMIFFLIGAPLGAIIRKGGLGMPVVISVMFFVIYYVISISGEKMAKEGTWSAIPGVWISTFILTPIAVYLIIKATNDSNLFNTDWYRAKFELLFNNIKQIKQKKHEGTISAK